LQIENRKETSLLASFNRSTWGDEPRKMTEPPIVTFFLTTDVKTAVAVTDINREIPLFHYEVGFRLPSDEPFDPAGEKQRDALLRFAEGHFLQNVKRDERQLERLFGPSLGTNCHGWTFLSGHVGIKGEHVDRILDDNHYVRAIQPQPGDVAIYREGAQLIHSGVVVNGRNGSLEVESKWGPFSVFRHAPDYYFRGECSFWRTSRSSHALALRKS
jgi:hypothetical protein